MILSIALALAPSALAPALTSATDVEVIPTSPIVVSAQNELRTPAGQLVHRTAAAISSAQFIALDGGDVMVARWSEERDGAMVERYSLRLGADKPFTRVRDARHTVHLRRGTFDPLTDRLPRAIDGLDASGEMHIVQFVTQPIEAYLDELRSLGVTIRNFLPESSRLVQMNGETAARVAELPFVRWVGTYSAADRIDESILAEVADGSLPPTRVHIQVMERGPQMKAAVAERVGQIGGTIDWMIPDGFRFDATLNAEQTQQVAALDEVLWIDPWGAPEEDMDKVRVDGGANTVEVAGGFTGTGVRGECMDGNVDGAHPDLQSNPIIFHGANLGSASHGTPVTGIVFGDGAASPTRRGLLPDGQPIFADYNQLTNRYTHTARLLQAPYTAVFQTNSWGSPRTTTYTSDSMEMDDLLFLNDLVILQSQSNSGSTPSRPQAWAKNVVGVGGIRHQNTQTLSDDSHFGNAGSTGPAADGRIKPDLSHWYDSIFTTQSGGGSTQFGGTSAATPITAGYFGLFYQMWHEGEFGNPTSTSVFESRPKATLARAFMINGAEQYQFSGNSDLRRVRQGWGRANIANLHEARDDYFWVNEDDVLQEGDIALYTVGVDPGTPELAVTMVYLDRPGTTSSSQHRINDLSLKVTEPGGATFYWGNNGLLNGMTSTSGGTSNTKDPVENVFIPNPVSGVWRIEVFADDINQDTHVETPALDADFALLVRGTTGPMADPCPPPNIYCQGLPNSVSGNGADVFFFGTTSVSANNMVLQGSGFPPNQFALAVRSNSQALVPLGSGNLCLGSPQIRMEVIQVGLLGQLSYAIDTTVGHQGSFIQPGDTWNYQFWYRDGTSTSNLSDAIEIVWCP